MSISILFQWYNSLNIITVTVCEGTLLYISYSSIINYTLIQFSKSFHTHQRTISLRTKSSHRSFAFVYKEIVVGKQNTRLDIVSYNVAMMKNIVISTFLSVAPKWTLYFNILIMHPLLYPPTCASTKANMINNEFLITTIIKVIIKSVFQKSKFCKTVLK